MVSGCQWYMSRTLTGSTARWSFFIFTLAHQINMKEITSAALRWLAEMALTDSSYLTPLSAALAAWGRPPEEQLAVLASGLHAAARGAAISEALLVVLIMRLDQLAGATQAPAVARATFEAAAAAKRRRTMVDPTGRTEGSMDQNSITAAEEAPSSLQVLSECGTAAMLELVQWETIHQAEIRALTSQAASYIKSSLAAERLRQHFLPQQAFAWLSRPLDSLPVGQDHTADYLACWLDTSAGKEPIAPPLSPQWTPDYGEEEPDVGDEWELQGCNRIYSNNMEVKLQVVKSGVTGE